MRGKSSLAITTSRYLLSVGAAWWIVLGALLLVLLNFVLTVTDEVGLPDVVYLVYCAGLLAALWMGMRQSGSPPDRAQIPEA